VKPKPLTTPNGEEIGGSNAFGAAGKQGNGVLVLRNDGKFEFQREYSLTLDD
jgi:hypothetical protein